MPDLEKVFPRNTDAILFLDETGTTNYFKPKMLADCRNAIAAGQKPPVSTIFGIGGVLFKRDAYSKFSRDLHELKLSYFGRSDFALHEFDIRKMKQAPFEMLKPEGVWKSFRADLDAIVGASDCRIIVATLDKVAMSEYPTPFLPYRYCLHVILERVINDRKNWGKTCRIVAENRDKGQNDDLTQELLRLQFEGGGSDVGNFGNTVSATEVRNTFDPVIVFRTKVDNDAGLQLADLAAGPIARHIHGMDKKETRSVTSIVVPKLRRSSKGVVRGYGIKCLPTNYPSCCPL